MQLIDANNLFRKLRKNLGNKNSEFAPEHIREIVKAYLDFQSAPAEGSQFDVKVFDNSDFGYYKVNIERPKRLRSQFSQEALEPLRFEKTLSQPMQTLFREYGELVYDGLEAKAEGIARLNEQEGWDLNKKQLQRLLDAETWKKPYNLYLAATKLWKQMGDRVYMDFNAFSEELDKQAKALDLSLSAAEKKAILNAVSVYDPAAEKVIRKIEKLSGDKLDKLLDYLGCKKAQLPEFGYYPTSRKDEYITYEAESDLRDTEQVPLRESIYDYFVREVKPHVEEAWINLDSVKIGYEISFNKYFYKHTPLRSLEEVKEELLNLEKQADGLLHDILNF